MHLYHNHHPPIAYSKTTRENAGADLLNRQSAHTQSLFILHLLFVLLLLRLLQLLLGSALPLRPLPRRALGQLGQDLAPIGLLKDTGKPLLGLLVHLGLAALAQLEAHLPSQGRAQLVEIADIARPRRAARDHDADTDDVDGRDGEGLEGLEGPVERVAVLVGRLVEFRQHGFVSGDD
jgi:hypothetical protein